MGCEILTFPPNESVTKSTLERREQRRLVCSMIWLNTKWMLMAYKKQLLRLRLRLPPMRPTHPMSLLAPRPPGLIVRMLVRLLSRPPPRLAFRIPSRLPLSPCHPLRLHPPPLARPLSLPSQLKRTPMLIMWSGTRWTLWACLMSLRDRWTGHPKGCLTERCIPFFLFCSNTRPIFIKLLVHASFMNPI